MDIENIQKFVYDLKLKPNIYFYELHIIPHVVSLKDLQTVTESDKFISTRTIFNAFTSHFEGYLKDTNRIGFKVLSTFTVVCDTENRYILLKRRPFYFVIKIKFSKKTIDFEFVAMLETNDFSDLTIALRTADDGAQAYTAENVFRILDTDELFEDFLSFAQIWLRLPEPSSKLTDENERHDNQQPYQKPNRTEFYVCKFSIEQKHTPQQICEYFSRLYSLWASSHFKGCGFASNLTYKPFKEQTLLGHNVSIAAFRCAQVQMQLHAFRDSSDNDKLTMELRAGILKSNDKNYELMQVSKTIHMKSIWKIVDLKELDTTTIFIIVMRKFQDWLRLPQIRHTLCEIYHVSDDFEDPFVSESPFHIGLSNTTHPRLDPWIAMSQLIDLIGAKVMID